jgi:hypothetical protein
MGDNQASIRWVLDESPKNLLKKYLKNLFKKIHSAHRMRCAAILLIYQLRNWCKINLLTFKF